MAQEKVKSVLKYTLFFALFYVLSNASIGGLFSPFAFGLYFALVWCGQKFYILAPLYFSATLFVNFDDITLFSTATTILVSSLIFAIHSRLKIPIKISLFTIYAFLSGTFGIIVQLAYGSTIFIPLISLIASILFMLATKEILNILLVRGLLYKLNLIETISALVCICAIFAGLANLYLFSILLFKLLSAFTILLSSLIFNLSITLLLACIIGISELVVFGSTLSLTPLVIWALVASCFHTQKRIFTATALILTEIVCGYYLNLYGVYSTLDLIPVLIACFVFLILPNSVLNEIRNFCNLSNSTIAMRNVVNRSRESLCRRLLDLGQVYGEMGFVFRAMAKSGMTKDEIRPFLANEIRTSICADCCEREHCHRSLLDTTATIFDNLISNALERGRISVLDVPPYLTTHCKRVSTMVGSINNLCLEYINYAKDNSNTDTSKILVAEQFSGISQVLKQLANEVSRNVSFDRCREETIISELSYNNIVCSEVVVYEQDTNAMNATLVIRKSDSNKSKIIEVVSDICKHKMAVVSVEPSKTRGWDVVTMKTAPKFDVVFGTATCPKATSKISGDCYSIIRISEDKFLLALCDGMGSGEKAERTSSLAIGLIENFYKAGFDNDIILSSINKLLSISRDEIFSALDICVIDTRSGVADFIKMGAPQSYMKHKNEIEEICGGALPLGIIQEVTPFIIKKVIRNGDFVYLFTDGISDSFRNENELADFVNNQAELNPQALAEGLINRAIELNGKAIDDMTVIVAKIFEIPNF